jgi:hypothetical protein
MEMIMESEQLKTAWQALSRQLERSDAINLHLLRESKLERARSSLRPLLWGQLLQILFGIGFVLLAAMLWMRAAASPVRLPPGTLLAGIALQVYGIATIALAGETIRQIRAIDYSAPVLGIQLQLGRLRRTYIINGMISGLPWWFLWVPVLMVLAGLGGDDLYARVPGLIWIGFGIGVVGLFGTWWFHRWLRSAGRPRLASAMDNAVTGSSLRKAQSQIEDLRRFGQE